MRLFEGPRHAGAAAGLRFDFERITRAPNTLLSHALIALVPEGAQQGEVVDAVYAAYFEHARDIGERTGLSGAHPPAALLQAMRGAMQHA